MPFTYGQLCHSFYHLGRGKEEKIIDGAYFLNNNMIVGASAEEVGDLGSSFQQPGLIQSISGTSQEGSLNMIRLKWGHLSPFLLRIGHFAVKNERMN